MEVAPETAQNNTEEEAPESGGGGSEPGLEKKEEEPGQCGADAEMQQILARVRQNFGKINVVPQFSGDDLVPLEMSDIEEELESLSGEREEEEEQEPEEDTDEEPFTEAQEEHTATKLTRH